MCDLVSTGVVLLEVTTFVCGRALFALKTTVLYEPVVFQVSGVHSLCVLCVS